MATAVEMAVGATAVAMAVVRVEAARVVVETEVGATMVAMVMVMVEVARVAVE